MIRFAIIVVFFALGTSCAHRHHDHVDHLTSGFLQDASDVLADSESSATISVVETVDPIVAPSDNTATEVDVLDTSTSIITAFDSSFDTTLFDAISLGSIANGDHLPTSDIATYAGHALLGNSIEGEVSLSIDFATHDATGQITQMTYFGDAGIAALDGQLDMSGQTVSRIGLKMDVGGTITSELTGTAIVTGTLRGLFYGGGPDGFAGHLVSETTLPVLEGQTLSGPVYAQ